MEPFCSIIIPTRNRPQQLSACLAALARLDYPRDRFEIIVVDDGSEAPVVAPGARMMRQQNAGPGTARNTGARAALGEFLVFTDDDCEPAADWLRCAAARLIANPGQLVGGHIHNALTRNACAEASQMLVGYLYSYYNAGPSGPSFFTSNNFAVGRASFLEIGGFDGSLSRAAAEDRELCDRWHQLGRGLTYAPEMIIEHSHALTLRRFWRQHFNYGRGAHYYHMVRAQRRAEPLRVEPAAFYFNLLRYPFTQAHGARALQLSSLIFIAQAANALGFFWERWTK